MNQPTPFLRLRALLGAALSLSLAAVAALAVKPHPNVPAAGQVFTSTGGEVQIEARTSHPAIGTTGTNVFTELTVTLTKDLPAVDHVSMAIVLDRSGSMSGQKMEDARRAVNRLIDLLRDGDELAVVSFGSDVTGGQLVRIAPDTRKELHDEVNALVASGGTNVSAGLNAGLEALTRAKGAGRVVFISDGQPTEGKTSAYELANLVAAMHRQSLTVTALGVGHDYDGALLTQLAERGGGMTGHLQNVATLEEVLGQELNAARSASARDVRLVLGFEGLSFVEAPGRTAEWTGDEVVLSLADLRPNVPTRVLVNCRPSGVAHGDVSRVTAKVLWRPLHEQERTSTVALSMPVIEDLDEVHTRDEKIFARGVTALGSLKVLAAASAYERGDDSTANSLLDEARGVFGMSADALAGDATVEVDSLRTKYRSSNAQERKSLNYGLQKKTLAHFGKENEGY